MARDKFVNRFGAMSCLIKIQSLGYSSISKGDTKVQLDLLVMALHVPIHTTHPVWREARHPPL